MKIETFNNYEELSHAASLWCQRKINQYQAESIFIPAGNTPKGLYKIWLSKKPDYLKDKKLIQIDDIFDGRKKDHFKSFFKENLSDYYHQLIPVEEGPRKADLCILGLGENGHVAFHEPQIDQNFQWGIVNLSELTCRNLGVDFPTQGMSYGVGQFLKAKAILLMVVGPNKKEAYRLMRGAKDTVPASYLLDHSDLTILVEKSILF